MIMEGIPGEEKEKVIRKMKVINDLSFIAEKGEDAMRYSMPRIREKVLEVIKDLKRP